jgi:hypothetical protein
MFGRSERITRLQELKNQELEKAKKVKDEKARQLTLPILTAQDIEALYTTKMLKSLDLTNYKSSSTKAVRLMQVLEKFHCEPININKSWFIYQFPSRINASWNNESPMNLGDYVAFEYSYPVPIEAYEKLRNIDAVLTVSGDFAKVFISAPSPYLGKRVEEQKPIPVIRIDPMLIVRIVFDHKYFYYNVCTWNLTEDLKFMKEEE